MDAPGSRDRLRETSSTTAPPSPASATPRVVLTLLVAQGAVAPVMSRVPAISDAVAVIAVAIGVVLALRSKRVEPVLYALAYIAGVEVLWRMTSDFGIEKRAEVAWELAKYGVATVALVYGARVARDIRTATLPLVFTLILIPGAVVSVMSLGIEEGVGAIASTLVGPVTLAACVFFFATIRPSWEQMRRAGWAAIVPIGGVAALALQATVRYNAEFIQRSNYVTSAGFAPNQVGSILGFGALLAAMLAMTEPPGSLRKIEIALALGFLTQSVLTFSRSGVLNVAVALIVGGLHVVRKRDLWATWVKRTALLGAIVLAIAIPLLNQFADQKLVTRFTNFDSAGRTAIATNELELWRQNWEVGIGAGVGKDERRSEDIWHLPSHTEVTRLLAEHGMGGVIAVVLLVALAVNAYRQKATLRGKVVAAMLLSWALTEMLHSSTRLAVVAVAFGAAMTKFADDP